MKGFFLAILLLALAGAAAYGGIMLEKRHSEGAFRYPWESTSSVSSSSKPKTQYVDLLPIESYQTDR